MKTKKILAFSIILSVGLFFCISGRGMAQTLKEEGRAAKDVWSGYWWATVRGEIIGPLSKYDQLTKSNSVEWEKKNHPTHVNGRPVPSWTGLCHAWAASSVLEEEPKTYVRSGNQMLTIGDQKGWLAVCHAGDVANIYGKRYNGPNDDPNDLAPEELWMVLRQHIKNQRVPIILDIEPHEQVWNYPVYAYRVEYAPKNAGSNIYNCKMGVWMADDAVSQDYIGIRRIYQEYTFEVELLDGSIVMGTGKWTGRSVNVHPDFAWFPYIIRPENPQVSYSKACELMGRKIAEVPAPSDSSSTNIPDTQNNTPNDTNNIPTDIDNSLTVPELFALIENKKSDFKFSVFLPQHISSKYTVGDYLQVGGMSEDDGYLYIFSINPDESISILYPQNGDDNRIRGKEEFLFPQNDSPYEWNLKEPLGIHHIKAVVTQKKLAITGSFGKSASKTTFEESSIQSLSLQDLSLRVPPTEIKSIQDEVQSKGGVLPVTDDLKEKIGRYAQAEVIFYLDSQNKTQN